RRRGGSARGTTIAPDNLQAVPNLLAGQQLLRHIELEVTAVTCGQGPREVQGFRLVGSDRERDDGRVRVLDLGRQHLVELAVHDHTVDHTRLTVRYVRGHPVDRVGRAVVEVELEVHGLGLAGQ